MVLQGLACVLMVVGGVMAIGGGLSGRGGVATVGGLLFGLGGLLTMIGHA